MSGQEGGEVGSYSDGSHAWSATPMRDAEGLVQIQVRYVRAESTRLSQPDEGIQIGSIDVDLTTCIVHLGADITHGRFENAVRRGVRDHQRCEPFGILGDLGLQIAHIDIAVLITTHHEDPHTSHHGTCRIGAMSAAGDEAQVALGLPPAAVIGPDGQEPGKLTLTPGIGLDTHGVVTGDLAQHGLKGTDEFDIPLHLIQGRKGMNIGEFGPGDRLHFCCGVELHRA